MKNTTIDPSSITGWACDADPKNEPTYPMKHYTGDDHIRKNWLRPALQKSDVEVLKSTEHPYITAVYGSKVPPRGLSGALRRFAFRYSENMYRHWLSLLLADRVDVVESFFGDIFRGRIPNPAGERGWGAIARYRPWLLVRKITVRLLLLGAIAAFIIYEVRYD